MGHYNDERESNFERMVRERRPDEVAFDVPEALRLGRRRREVEQEGQERSEEVSALPVESGREAAGLQDALQRGGQGTGGEGGAEPQTDDPDDGEHTDSEPEEAGDPEETESEPTNRPRQEPQEPATRPVETKVVSEVTEDVEEPQKAAHVPRERRQAVAKKVAPKSVADDDGEPLFVQNRGFEFPGKSTMIRAFPEDLIKTLGDMVAERVGTHRGVPHNASLLAGFILAQLGLPTDGYDEGTVNVATILAGTEPRMVALETTIELLSDTVGGLAGQLHSQSKAMRELAMAVEGVEIAEAFLLSDRVEMSAKDYTSGASADLSHPRAAATRENIRRTAKRAIEERRIKDGRPLR